MKSARVFMETAYLTFAFLWAIFVNFVLKSF